jgi:hypothetical protein
MVVTIRLKRRARKGQHAKSDQTAARPPVARADQGLSSRGARKNEWHSKKSQKGIALTEKAMYTVHR